MSSKITKTKCERRKDQLAGFWVFTFINVPMLLIVAIGTFADSSYRSPPEWITTAAGVLPWVINLVILVLGLVLRPQFATGFLVSLLTWAAASLLYVPSCMATCMVLDADYEGSDSFFYCFTTGYLLIWGGLAAWRSYALYKRDCLSESE